MPHIVIEHSANLGNLIDLQRLVDAVHEAALADGLAPVDALRTRATGRDHYRIADGDPAYGFVALTARIGPGRPTADKKRFVTALIDTIDDLLAPHRRSHPVAISAEVQEIDPEFRINRNHVRAAMEEKS